MGNVALGLNKEIEGGDTCTGLVRAFLDGHLGWSSPSGVNNNQLTTKVIEAECRYTSNPGRNRRPYP